MGILKITRSEIDTVFNVSLGADKEGLSKRVFRVVRMHWGKRDTVFNVRLGVITGDGALWGDPRDVD